MSFLSQNGLKKVFCKKALEKKKYLARKVGLIFIIQTRNFMRVTHSPARVESSELKKISFESSRVAFLTKEIRKEQLKKRNSTRLEKSRVLLEFKMIRGSLQGYGVTQI
jgi:hypothetical protein